MLCTKALLRWMLFGLLGASSALLAKGFSVESPPVFPTSTRQALLQKAKAINDAKDVKDATFKNTDIDLENDRGYRYTKRGWSNRAATVLTPIHVNDNQSSVYTGDRPFYWNSIDVGCRMTVIELPKKNDDNSNSENNKPDLWVLAPVGLDAPLKKALDKIGTVKYVAAPNFEHVSFISAWYKEYPQAQYWGCPGLMEKMQDISFTGEIPFHYRPVNWQGTKGKKAINASVGWDENLIQGIHIDCEHNPFTFTSFFNEVVYYHAPTKTLITTDSFWNYPSSTVPNEEFGRNDAWELAPEVDNVPFKSRLWKVGMDQVFHPFYLNLMIKDKDAFREIANHIVNVWDVETIIPAHGDILRGKDFCQSVLRKHFEV